ncbi:Eco57I restriction-modification methylase domain-containing protein [Kibdelosporangium philippinense]|uniref:site-specific DNA-methyltransferase (adenine-specific) n=1 Tax=Kibdelosporangium philippinense TaxID=211113 RepID=A0ABS8ZVN3_9PSEU|nr:Eco57I restriction-modification methylase domain-containing protein [Kibdelosporangium philippinense]MCE7011794.1 Eco57I restriction-modification methylase domain-containing protein [Kibdelosporangium philippinense]
MVTRELFGLDTLHLPESLQDAIEHGEVFTRRWVVESILDLVGYTADRDLADMVIVEPACGAGAFLGPITERLSASCRNHGRSLLDAVAAVEAFDLLDRNVERSRDLVTERLLADDWESSEVAKVVHSWIGQGDYLLREYTAQSADFVVGNPPYIRLEDVPDARMSAYRANCPTMGGRADIYVGFYEVGLRSLKPGGQLGFICADRWMRNQYGRKLRELVARRYSMDLVLVMHDVDAFKEQVSAYPAITIISNRPQGEAVAADTTHAFGPEQAKTFLAWVARPEQPQINAPSYHAARLPHWFAGDDSWPAASPARLAMLEDLGDRFRLLEDEATGTRVGIGIATGADKIFVVQSRDDADVEDDRLLPMAMVRDTRSGVIDWHGTYLVNPWSPEGNLVSLADYPRMARYFARYGADLRKRYIAVKQPDRWYKTIDKVDHRLTARPKLLFPDMKLTIHPVLDEGGLYPHHNLYFIVSDMWDLRVLGGLLLSKVAEAFVAAYAVKMRGGTLRFQAQYLRKIRVPDPAGISEGDRAALADAFDRRDVQAATTAALSAYGLTELPD